MTDRDPINPGLRAQSLNEALALADEGVSAMPIDPAVEAVQITMTHGELSVLVLAASETSTAAQRQHAREVLYGYVTQAFDAITEQVVHGRQ